MNLFDWIQIFFFILSLVIFAPLLGKYMVKVFQGEVTFYPLKCIEQFTYRVSSINPTTEMNWKGYLNALLFFNLLGILFLFLIQIAQPFLPWNPQNFGSVPWSLALNTAISFTTNTNWQAYAGETTLSYFTQMVGITVQNFLSAATGCATLLVLIRGINRKCTDLLGNFWVDIVRIIIYLLLPLAFLLSIFLVSQGVIQTLSPYVKVKTIENVEQTIPLGPVASQVAIKQLGTNGGGFFNTNSSHPFENPNSITNFFETVAIMVIPVALLYAYGLLIGSKKEGFLLLFTISLIWIGALSLSLYSENLNNPLLQASPLLEGKEMRIGSTNTILWSVSTTATANGSVNGMQESLTPLAGGVALFNMMLGEVLFGGIGVGLCTLLMFVFLTVFLSGLMMGRLPQYRGKKLGIEEMIWVSIAILVPSILILLGSGITTFIQKNLFKQGPHGLTEVLYTFASTATNNGSSFAGYQVNTTYHNLFLALVMLIGRLAIIIPTIMIAGLLAPKKNTPLSIGTFSTQTFLFVPLLLGVIVTVGALTFFPALSLGPLLEHFLMLKGRSF